MSAPRQAKESRDHSEYVVLTLVVVAALAIVAWRLGPSLLGQRVFLGVDMFASFPPWSEGQPRSEPAQNGYVWDHLDFFIPGYAQIVDRLLQGDFPLWSPLVGGGTPLLAQPNYGIFSPARWPYLIFPLWMAPAWSKLAELAIAGIGCYLLLRRLRMSKPAAALAGAIYPFTGFMLAWTNWPQTAVAALIPALFWSVERFAQERRIRAAAPIAVIVAGMMFGGFPAVTGLSLYAAGAYLLVRLLVAHATGRWWRPERPRALLRDVAVALAAVVVGVALSAVQVLPFLYSFLGGVDLSYRDEGFFRVEPLKHLLTAVFPGSFAGNGLDVFSGPFNPIEVNTYVGTAALVLVILAIVRRPATASPRAARGYFVGLAVVGLLLIWVQGPLLEWLGHLPVFDGNPIGRLRALLGFAAAVLAGFGFDALLRAARDGYRPGRRTRVGEIVALLVGLAVLGWAGWQILSGRVRGLAAGHDADVWIAVGVAAGVVLLVLLGHYDHGRRWARWSRYVGVALIPLLIAGQAGLAADYYWPTGDRSRFYASTPVHEFLAENLGGDRVATAGNTLWPSSTAYYGLRTVNGHAFLPVPMRDLLLAIDPSAYPAPTMSSFHPLSPNPMIEPGLDRLAARYYATGFDTTLFGVAGQNAPPRAPMQLEPGEEYRTTMLAQPLRGIGISVLEGAPSGLVTLDITIRDQTGNVVASGSRNLDAPTPGSHFIPLVGEDLPADGSTWSVEISTSGESSVPIMGSAPDQPQLVTLAPANDGLRLAYVGQGTVVWERLTSLPRIRWASEVEMIADPAERLQAVAHDADLGSDTVVLAEPGDADGAPAELTVLVDAGDTIRVNVDAEGDGYLVVADNIQSDWVATVDGAQVPIVDADHALGAVHVNRGEHEIVLRYAPRGAVAGAAISATAAVLLVAVALPGRFWRGLSRGIHRGLRGIRGRRETADGVEEQRGSPGGRFGDPAGADNDT